MERHAQTLDGKARRDPTPNASSAAAAPHHATVVRCHANRNVRLVNTADPRKRGRSSRRTVPKRMTDDQAGENGGRRCDVVRGPRATMRLVANRRKATGAHRARSAALGVMRFKTVPIAPNSTTSQMRRVAPVNAQRGSTWRRSWGECSVKSQAPRIACNCG